MPIATKASWKTTPMPGKKVGLAFKRLFTEEEMEKVRVVFIPMDMDDRWFIYTEGDTINFHRSWTGHCIYQAHIGLVKKGFEVKEVWVNRDPEEYTNTDEKSECDNLNQLIEIFLLK